MRLTTTRPPLTTTTIATPTLERPKVFLSITDFPADEEESNLLAYVAYVVIVLTISFVLGFVLRQSARKQHIHRV